VELSASEDGFRYVDLHRTKVGRLKQRELTHFCAGMCWIERVDSGGQGTTERLHAAVYKTGNKNGKFG
jgi:hypothetical protein